MDNNWKKIKLSDIAEIVMGQSPKSKFYNTDGDGLPFFQGKAEFGDVYPSVKKWCIKPLKVAKKNDVLMTVRAPVGDLNIAKGECIIGRGLCALRSKLNNGRFIYYLLKANNSYIISFGSGAVYDAINKDSVGNFIFNIPDEQVQCKISSILSAYDDLIENNTRRIQILEEMAQRIYREWFVEFRFPGHEKVKFVNSELGKIPEGWEVKKIREFGKIITGKTPSTRDKGNYGNYMQFIKTPDMHGNIFIIQTEQHLSKKGADSQKNKTLPPGSICVSCIGTAGVVSITTEYSQTNQQINSIVLNDEVNLEYLFFSTKNLKEIINNYGRKGATLVNLNKEEFSSLKIIYPSCDLVKNYHNFVTDYFKLIRNLLIKNKILRQTRDLLLPKLISGELDISDLDIAIREQEE